MRNRGFRGRAVQKKNRKTRRLEERGDHSSYMSPVNGLYRLKRERCEETPFADRAKKKTQSLPPFNCGRKHAASGGRREQRGRLTIPSPQAEGSTQPGVTGLLGDREKKITCSARRTAGKSFSQGMP